VRFEVQRLAVNFRSRSSLVNWVNDCFGRILPRTDDRERGAIAYRPSEAASADPAAPGAQPAVALRGFATRADESTAIAEMIASAAERNPEWRIAVLVRARSHARDIAAALRNRGVGFHAVEIEPLDDRSIVRDVIALTCALLHLGERTAWLAVLRAPWAGLELADLLRIARAGPLVWSSLADEALLNELSAEGRARCRRLRSTLEGAFRVRNDSSVARWVERTWLGLGGASCAASAEGLELANAAFARLKELERVGLPDAADLPDAFSDLYADHGPPSNVEIMTIHKAKGLEFDMVVLPALDRTPPHGRHQLLAVHQFARTGRNGLVMGARPGVGDEDRLFEFLRHQQRDAAALEAERLLYVACTRAKRQLRLTAVLDAQHPSNQSRPPKSGSLLAVLWPVAAAEFAVAESDAAAQPAGPPRGGPLLRVPRDWAPSMTGASPTPTLPQSPLPRIETLVFDWAGETARRVGSLVHAELQSMTIDSIDEAMIRSREMHFRRWLALHGVPGERLPEAAARVVDALLAVLGDPRGRWILQAAREDAREQALSGRVEGAIARVIFDRSFVDEQGVRWVIDYKTSRHVGGGLQEFLDREVERYRPQLQRYALLAQKLGPEPVRLGLYFPLMRQWREWAA
jgi:ATP-dependent exoDNAse (exonuclease V) beta subunit